MESNKLWGGRFSKDFAIEVEDFLQSIEVDKHMVFEDIWGSQAHAIMLAKQRIIGNHDLEKILYWLEKAREDFVNGNLSLSAANEDVHMNVEQYLIQGAGAEYGGKLHTARSRNDQVLTDTKLYVRGRILGVKRALIDLEKVFLDLAGKNIETPMPGFTHTQHAQPITLAYWATAYVSMFLRDTRRLDHAYDIVDTNPLGSCALAGSSFPIDRRLTSKLMGFRDVHRHSLDAISSRDFIGETLFALTTLMSNLSRLAEEIVYWSTYEFAMIELDDSYSAGSSIMPQKKNPCVAELTRARTGRVYGAMMQFLTTMKGIPMGYNRDLQEDKPPLWEALTILEKSLSVAVGTISTMRVNKDRMEELSGSNFSAATELANYLVREQNLTFRECHHIVGSLVGELHRKDKTFMDFEEVEFLLSQFGVTVSWEEMKQIFDPCYNIRNFKSLGSTAPNEVLDIIEDFKGRLAKDLDKLEEQEWIIDQAKGHLNSVISEVLSGKEIHDIDL